MKVGWRRVRTSETVLEGEEVGNGKRGGESGWGGTLLCV